MADQHPHPDAPKEQIGTAHVQATRSAHSGDVDEYRKKYGKEEGERRFHAENQPTETVHHEPGKPS